MSTNLDGKMSFSLQELGRLVNAEVRGDPDLLISGIAPLESAGPGQISFLIDSRYRNLASGCRASALLVSPKFEDLEFNLLVARNPQLALVKILKLFLPEKDEPASIHPGAFIGERVHLGEGVSVGPFAHVGDNSTIGDGTVISPTAYLGKNVRIGEKCVIAPRVSILDGCIIGNRVVIHAGTVIGADGYGYVQDEQGRHVKIPQTGIVQIDDDVEIGANTTIDRAAFGKTWIKRGVKIDNLVMVAHNVVVGEDSLLVAQVGVSGSTKIGNNVLLAGQVGIVGHVKIGDGVKVGAKSGIHHSIEPNQLFAGYPAVPQNEFVRNFANVQRLPRLREALKNLESRVRRIEEALEENDVGYEPD